MPHISIQEQEELYLNRAIQHSLNEANINTLTKADILFKTLLSQISNINSSVDTGDVDTGELTSHLILQHYNRYIKLHTAKLKEKILAEDYIKNNKKKLLLDNHKEAILELLTKEVANMISQFNDLLEKEGKDIDIKKSCNNTKYLQIIEALAILDIMIDNNTNMKPLEDEVLTYLTTYCPEMVLFIETMRTEQDDEASKDDEASRLVTEELERIRKQDDIPNLTVDELSNELYNLYFDSNFPLETIKSKLTEMIELLPVKTFLIHLDTELEIATAFDVNVSKEILVILENLLDDKLLDSKIKDLNEQEIEMELLSVNNKADLKYISQQILDKYRNRLQEQQKQLQLQSEQQKQLQLEQQKQLQLEQQTRKKFAIDKLRRSVRRRVNKKKKTELQLTNAHQLFIKNELEIQKEIQEANELKKQKLERDNKEKEQISQELIYEKQDKTLAQLMSEDIELQKLQKLFETKQQTQELNSNIGKLTLEEAQERQRLIKRLQEKESGLNDDKQEIVRAYGISLDEYIKSETFKQSFDNKAAVEMLISEIPNLTLEEAQERQRLLKRLQEDLPNWSDEKIVLFTVYSKALDKDLNPFSNSDFVFENGGFSTTVEVDNAETSEQLYTLEKHKDNTLGNKLGSKLQYSLNESEGGKKSRKQRKSRKYRKQRKSRKQRKQRKSRKHSKQRKSKTI